MTNKTSFKKKNKPKKGASRKKGSSGIGKIGAVVLGGIVGYYLGKKLSR